jgi:hypothetical protein
MPGRRIAPQVSIHAIRRYLERRKGFAINGKVDGLAVRAFAQANGIDVQAVQQSIQEIVARGVAAGAPAVLYRGYRFYLSGETVITMTRVSKPRRRKRARVEADNEFG